MPVDLALLWRPIPPPPWVLVSIAPLPRRWTCLWHNPSLTPATVSSFSSTPSRAGATQPLKWRAHMAFIGGVGGVNRLGFLVRGNVNVTRDAGGADNFQIGTYIRDHADGVAADQGAHYYHLLDPNWYANKVMKIVVNACPQHKVGQLSSIN